MVGMGVMATLEEVIMDSTMAALMAVRARETRGGWVRDRGGHWRVHDVIMDTEPRGGRQVLRGDIWR